MARILVEVGEESVTYRPPDDHPRPLVVHVPGFNGDALTDAPFALRVAAAGFHTVALQPPWVNTPELSDPSPALLFELLEHADTLLDRERERAIARDDTLDWVALTGFSLGGMFVTRVLARAGRERVDAVALALSSGDWSFLPRTTLDAFPHLQAAVPIELLEAAEAILEAESPVAHGERFPPTPLLMVNAEHDPWLPLTSARRFHERLRAAYDDAGVGDVLAFEIFSGRRHEFRRAMQRRVRDWLLERRHDESA